MSSCHASLPSSRSILRLPLLGIRRRYASVADLPPFSLLPSNPTLFQIRQVHAQLFVHGHAFSRAAMGHLLAACAVSSTSSLSPDYPRSVFHRILVPNLFATNNLIRCLGSTSEALGVYAAMRRRGTPTNNYTFPFVLEACGKEPPLVLEGLQVHAQVVRLGQDGDVFVRNALIHFYCACREIEDARKVFDEIRGRRGVASWNATVAGCPRDGRVGDCVEMFQRIPVRDSVSWSIMILGYVQAGFLEMGLRLFGEMRKTDMEVNEATWVAVLSVCGQLGLLEHGKSIHAEIKAMNFPMSLRIETMLIDMYAKCGCIVLSKKIFDAMPQRDPYAWNSMLCGLAAHGLARQALELFQRFVDEDLRPTGVTFVGVLNACARAGLIKEGRQYFEAMVTLYGIEPEMEHYGCMVDLLGRAGLISEAIDLIEGMRIPPDPVLWGTLLGACKIHGRVELGTKIGKKLIELEPAHDGHYVLLSGVYAKAKKWEDVASVRKLMSSRGNSKVAGWSLIEAQGRVHRFVAGDRGHCRSSEIHDMNDLIRMRLMEAGYVPDVSSVFHDIGDEEKVNMIQEHSERLAIAFGLLVFEVGHPIRIVKNLRVCGDCHVVSKMISRLFEREIIVRDGSRFHHFKNGNCSCNDYW